MKKKVIFLAMCFVLVASAGSVVFAVTKQSDLFDQNVSILSLEDNHMGYCEESSGACITQCPVCGKMVEAVGDHKGPASGVTEKEFHILD